MQHHFQSFATVSTHLTSFHRCCGNYALIFQRSNLMTMIWMIRVRSVELEHFSIPSAAHQTRVTTGVRLRHAHPYTSKYIHTPIYIQIYPHILMYVHSFIYTHVHPYTSKYTQIHSCTPKHTHIHQNLPRYTPVHQNTPIHI